MAASAHPSLPQLSYPGDLAPGEQLFIELVGDRVVVSDDGEPLLTPRTLKPDDVQLTSAALWLRPGPPPTTELQHTAAATPQTQDGVAQQQSQDGTAAQQQTRSVRSLLPGPWGGVLSEALSLMKFREATRFHPMTGARLSFPPPGTVGVDPAGNQVFPRLDPAVIGLIIAPSAAHVPDPGAHPVQAFGDLLLLGENASRPGRWSLIAGYVSPGESAEQAMRREAREETGRQVGEPHYLKSATWPLSASLMLGFAVPALELEPSATPDGELARTRWVTAHQLREGQTIATPPPGSLAHDLINWWCELQLPD